MEKDFEEAAIESSEITCFILEDMTDEEALEIAEMIMKGVEAAIDVIVATEALQEATEVVYD